ncbi:MAG: CPBP family intramembrane metalloprotease [Gemmatimonadales bacterium]|nr:CPBP family intramembrane metalloprotease [Gemmatimonadales bacterium]
MGTILSHLKQYVRENARPWSYLLVAAFLIVAFYVNYGLDFKGSTLRVHRSVPRNLVFYLVFFAVPYISTLLIVLCGSEEAKRLRERRFWLTCGFMLVVLALNRTALRIPELVISHLEPVIFHQKPGAFEIIYWQRCLVNLVRLAALGGPVWVFWKLFQKEIPHFYGLQWRGFHWRPYLIMLALMVPPIVWASFQSSFLETYPLCRPNSLTHIHDWPVWMTYTLHEFFYALRFIGVEIFFRGFLVLGMVRWLGKATLLPMVVLYAFWHFGKPFPEALGSVFGSYILGVLALRTKSINGGILIHMGIALLMNLAAFIQHQVR